MRTLTLLLCLCGSAPALAQPAEVILIRHGEKLDDGSDDLSQRGWERAAALVPYFMGRPEVLSFKTPAAIYAQAPKKEGSSLRPLHTVKGLAHALNLDVVQKYTRDDFPKMVAEILANPAYQGKTVLICWEHKVIPDIAHALGAKDAPDKFHDVYDRTWVLTFEDGGKVTFKNLPQQLLYNDSKE
jgi:hypothetical protein